MNDAEKSVKKVVIKTIKITPVGEFKDDNSNLNLKNDENKEKNTSKVMTEKEIKRELKWQAKIDEALTPKFGENIKLNFTINLIFAILLFSIISGMLIKILNPVFNNGKILDDGSIIFIDGLNFNFFLGPLGEKLGFYGNHLSDHMSFGFDFSANIILLIIAPIALVVLLILIFIHFKKPEYRSEEEYELFILKKIAKKSEIKNIRCSVLTKIVFGILIASIIFGILIKILNPYFTSLVGKDLDISYFWGVSTTPSLSFDISKFGEAHEYIYDFTANILILVVAPTMLILLSVLKTIAAKKPKYKNI